MKSYKEWLIERYRIEKKKFDCSGIYAYTQCLMAYHSNKIEGSMMTLDQTISLFNYGILSKSDDYYRTKDIEEMIGHFLMFNYMLGSLGFDLNEDIIKKLHYELKSGVFEDRLNGYAIGDYKKRLNMVGMYKTALPSEVSDEMKSLLEWYSDKEKTIETLAEFHARYESIHPFQDGNGRTGRMILFRESLRYDALQPFIILDEDRNEYLESLKQFREENKVDKLIALIHLEANKYYSNCKYFMSESEE